MAQQKNNEKQKTISWEDLHNLNMLYIESMADDYDQLPSDFFVTDMDMVCMLIAHDVHYVDVLTEGEGNRCTFAFRGSDPVVRMVATYRRLGKPVFVDGWRLLSARREFQSIIRNAQATKRSSR
jgi:hypothetical protein